MYTILPSSGIHSKKTRGFSLPKNNYAKYFFSMCLLTKLQKVAYYSINVISKCEGILGVGYFHPKVVKDGKLLCPGNPIVRRSVRFLCLRRRELVSWVYFLKVFRSPFITPNTVVPTNTKWASGVKTCPYIKISIIFFKVDSNILFFWYSENYRSIF